VNDAVRREELDRFYETLAEVATACGGSHRLAACSGRMDWPQRGVYFFFEDGEVRENGVTPRVRRVGTHALRPSKSTLWGRLSQHKGSDGGSTPGGGNHRGSVFRLHVGMALLETEGWSEEIGSSWSVGSTARSAVRKAEYPLEQAVSSYIGAMPFLWVAVEDPPGPGSDRGIIEAGAIALLSNLDRKPIDPPSGSWLGRRSARDVIRRSGLWNVNHVADASNRDFLAVLERWVDHAT
jgi:hypothetical protein